MTHSLQTKEFGTDALSTRPIRFVLTCEHGGNEIPTAYQGLFDSGEARQHLASHRGYDPGALEVAVAVSKRLNVPLLFSTVSRLLVDLNRSQETPNLFSKFVNAATVQTRQAILDEHYHPYRNGVRESIQRSVDDGYRVLHISVHTFTPRFRGTQRRLDIGILFDPARAFEAKICARVLSELSSVSSGKSSNGFRVRFNEPYLGTDDGFTTVLRQEYGDACYAGIELELNNRIAKLSERTRVRWCDRIASSFLASVADAG
ncbi:N-formylglutamate amidohydrolase [Stieleria varia]|uniref:N-formylglutamate amidohydrolase n=1 Tax=Stieleria varia TaxID=2528005 RepID=A0A5C6A6N8_9BACT|nr:N-formylglutamate amidohydrolase [Stieleria varia]TWT94003.1 N-formylglutamate amidohydrolase [Stieleria varia]